MQEKTVNEAQYKKARALLREKIPLSRYIEDNKLGYISSTGKGKINCPIHGENTPSFFYDDSIGSFNCFGCGAGGTVLELNTHIQRETKRKYSGVQSMYDLAKTYEIELPDIYSYSDEGKLSNRIRRRKRGERTSVSEDIDKRYIYQSTSLFLYAPLKVRYIVGIIQDKYQLGEIDTKTTAEKLRKLEKEVKAYQRANHNKPLETNGGEGVIGG